MKKLSGEEQRYVLPMVQRAVQAQIDRWDAECEIEHYFDTQFVNMRNGLEDLAVSFDSGDQVTWAAAKEYVELLEEEWRTKPPRRKR